MASLTQHDSKKELLFRIRIYCPLLFSNDTSTLNSPSNVVNPTVESSIHSERLLPAIETYRLELKVLQPHLTTESVASTHENASCTPLPQSITAEDIIILAARKLHFTHLFYNCFALCASSRIGVGFSQIAPTEELVTVKGDNVNVHYADQLHLRFVVSLQYDPSGENDTPLTQLLKRIRSRDAACLRYLFWQMRFDLAWALHPPDARVHQLANAWSSLVPLVHRESSAESHDQRLINALHEEILVLHKMAHLFTEEPPALQAPNEQDVKPAANGEAAVSDAPDAEPIRSCLFLPTDEQNLEQVVRKQFKRTIGFLEHAVSRIEPIGRNAMTTQFLKDSDKYWRRNMCSYIGPLDQTGRPTSQMHTPRERDELLASNIISFLHNVLDYFNFHNTWEILFGQWVALDPLVGSVATGGPIGDRVPYECFYVGRVNTNLPVLRVLRFQKKRSQKKTEQQEAPQNNRTPAEHQEAAVENGGDGVSARGGAQNRSLLKWASKLFAPNLPARLNTKLRKLEQNCETICAISAIVNCFHRAVNFTILMALIILIRRFLIYTTI